MKKKLKGLLGAIILIPTVAFIIFYLFVSLYYTDGFTFNTRINGVYCTGKSVEEVNSELIEAFQYDRIVVKSEDYGTKEEILLSDIDYTVDYTEALRNVFGKQSPFLWILNASKSSVTNNIKPTILYNEEELKKRVNSLELVKQHTEEAQFISEIRFSKEDGYYYYEKIDEIIDTDKLFDLVTESLDSSFTVDVTRDCFFVNDETPEMLHDKRVWNEVSDFLTPKLSFDMGDGPFKLDSSVLSNFIIFDFGTREFLKNEDGSLYISRDKVDSYIDFLCDRYDTYAMPREFVTHLGEVKTINFSNYGTLLDRKSEKEYLFNALLTGEEGVHEPKYIHEPYKKGLNDIGDTYVEVDMSRQVLYFIKSGEVKLFCDVVTGKPSAGYSTPEMICYVYNKVPGKYLTGPDYRSYVNFWMPVYKAIGLHDASWQSAFGGDRYLRHGSRGCINMRYDDAETLYNAIEIGTPVIIYK